MPIRRNPDSNAPGEATPRATTSPAEPEPEPFVPPWDQAEFDELLGQMVDTSAPRVFAVAQVCRECVDARVAAWGMAFEGHADVIATDQNTWMSLQSPDNALAAFTHSPDVTARLVWLNPAAAETEMPESDERRRP